MNNVVLHFSYDFPPYSLWGMGKHVAESLEQLSKLNIVCIAATRNTFALKELSVVNKVTVIRSLNNWDKHLIINKYQKTDSYTDFRLLQSWNLLLKNRVLKYLIINSIKPKIIHNHNWMTWPAAYQLSLYFNVPLISSYHFLEYQYLQFGKSSTIVDRTDIINIEKDSLQYSAACIVFSDITKKMLIDKYLAEPEKIHIIPHGVNLNEIDYYRKKYRKEKNNNKIRIIFVGRLVKEKGIDYLLKAAKKILLNFNNVSFFIVGTSNKFVHLKKNYGSDKIVFLDYLQKSDLYRIYAQSDIFCLPTLSETFGLAIIEAMSFGLSVVTTVGETVPHHVIHEKSGLLVNLFYQNKQVALDINELYTSLKKLIQDKNLRNRLSINARREVRDKYDRDTMVRKLVNLYNTF